MDIGNPLLIFDMAHNLSQISYVGIFLLFYALRNNQAALVGFWLCFWAAGAVIALMALEFHVLGINWSLDFASILIASGLIALMLAIMNIPHLSVILGIVLVVAGYIVPPIVGPLLPSSPPSIPSVPSVSSVPYPSYFRDHRTQGTTAVNDALTQSSGSSWETSKDGTCRFSDQVYYVKNSAMNHFHGCFGPKTTFQDLTYEVKMTIGEGGDCGGLVFGDNTLHSAFYLFRVCQDGSYNLMQYNDGNGFWRDILPYRTSMEIKRGAGETNLIAVLIQGSDIYFYINGVQVSETPPRDTQYTGGLIGLGAYSRSDAMTEVAYQDVRVWTK